MKQKDIVNIANEKNVPKTTIDKDWVLGHFLDALYSFEDLRKVLVFKDGTCLHKCYIEDYRFSEDLDFTLLDKGFAIDKKLIRRIIDTAQRQSIARYHISNIEHQIHLDVPQGYRVEIKFWGADHNPNQRSLPPARWQTSIHLDISFSEQLVLPSVERKILHPYPDANMISRLAVCYDFKELFAEKIRALMQRNRPRDIYDVWFLSTRLSQDELPEIKALLFEKSRQKNIEISGTHDFVNLDKFQKNNRAWSNSLAHQVALANLPAFEIVYQDLGEFIEKLLSVNSNNGTF